MTALFADTFFWIALADFTDSAHRRALAFAIEQAGSPIVTTDEVLVEYLTFFATAHDSMRSKAVTHAQRILEDPGVCVVPQSRQSFLSGMALYGSSRQRVQPDGLHFDADHAPGRAYRSPHQRPAF